MINIEIKKNIDVDDWLMKSAYSEREDAYKILNNIEIREALQRQENFYFIEARIDNEFAGLCTLGKYSGSIMGLFVFPNFQNIGIGTRLIQFCKYMNNNVSIATSSKTVEHIATKAGFTDSSQTIINSFTGKIEQVYRFKSNKCTI